MKKTSIALAGIVLLSACAPQSTPSMMSTSLPRLEQSTALKQILVDDVNAAYLQNLAADYHRYGAGAMPVLLLYDPKSPYRKMKAFEDLASVKAGLAKQGVKNVKAEVVDAEGSDPILMISYDSISAHAPAGCRNMPGFDDGLTTREIGDYRFGCSVDTMLARQIYRPADLAGTDGADPIDGRRAVSHVEYYRQVTSQESEGDLRVFDRGDIQQ